MSSPALEGQREKLRLALEAATAAGETGAEVLNVLINLLFLDGTNPTYIYSYFIFFSFKVT